MRLGRPVAALVLLLSLSVPTLSANLPIQIDGDYADWTVDALIGTDALGDDGSSGIDFTQFYIANDERRLYIRFDTTVEVQGDEGQGIVFGLDTDRNPGTGLLVGSIGADLVWYLGGRTGFFYPGGSPQEIGHAEVGLVLAPTVSDVQFEIAIDRFATPLGNPLFPGPGFDALLWDDAGGDMMGPFGYDFVEGDQPVTTIALYRDDPNHIRISSYNVENDGLFESGAREAALDRILDAIDPDVWVFCEVWNHDAGDVANRIEEFLPSGEGESWSAVKLDAGNVVVSRFSIIDSWEILPGSRLTGVLVDLRPRYDSDLLVVANHWSCCTADENRQEQADALTAFLRDARSAGGQIDLVDNTPIVAVGDFNLVGLRRQLETLITGDIDDNGTWGIDSPPDWDGSDFELALARHPDARYVYTWRNDFSSFYPGRLDYFCYTGSVAALHNNFTLETRTMTPESLAAAGLLIDDTETASDHGPVVGDLTLGVVSDVAVGEPDARPAHMTLRAVEPNPFVSSTTVTVKTASPGDVHVTVHDVTGRLVRSLPRDVSSAAGIHRITWDGMDDGGIEVPPGVYWYNVESGGEQVVFKVVRIR